MIIIRHAYIWANKDNDLASRKTRIEGTTMKNFYANAGNSVIYCTAL